MAKNGTIASTSKTASPGRAQSARSRPRGHERHPIRPANRMPVERIERHGHRHFLIRPPTVHGMDTRRRVQKILETRPTPIRFPQRHQLALGIDGRRDDESAAWGEKTGPNPTDRAKKGTKRSTITDAKGIPLGLAIDGANRHDVKMTRETLESIVVRRPRPTKKRKQNLCLDAGYAGDEVKALAAEFGFTLHVRPRGQEAKEIKRNARKKARRWVVERTHSWLNRFRRILIRWEKYPETFIAMLHLACGIITWRSTGLLG